jgi:hypothetical protein
MRQVMARIDARLEAFRELPLHAFMADESIDPELRLPFAPATAHYIMAFQDLCSFALRSEPAGDPYQELINTHVGEESDHAEWFLGDLARLGLDSEQRLSDAIRMIWARDNIETRRLTYRLCALAYGASGLRKLVLLQCVEATFNVGIERTAKVARQIADRRGQALLFYGSHHEQAEDDHSMDTAKARAMLEAIEIDDATRRDLERTVDEAFDAYTNFVNEIHRIGLSRAGSAR